ncbi:MAG: hypothetical protein MUE30_01670 [Spirosomaceae bacterium]|jgi:hypothetical protein|nr:hypothetical protein [Spirosomataceae bacterium]
MERNPNDRSAKIMRLIELIEHINLTIAAHQQEGEPDVFVIEEYEYRRAQYFNELADLMQPLGVAISWHTQNAA